MQIHTLRHVFHSPHDNEQGHCQHGHGHERDTDKQHGHRCCDDQQEQSQHDHRCCADNQEQGQHGHGHGRHHDCHGEGKGRGRGQHRGKGLRRLFDHGDLHIMVLSLVAKKPSYGYELIKDIEEASSGLYVPSPGVIYPTLTLLEEQGFLVSEVVEKNRKSFSLTTEGLAHLDTQRETEKVIFRKLAKARDMQQGGNLSEDIETAVHRFKALLRHKMVLKQLNEEQTKQIAAIINNAVQQIEQVNTLLTRSNDE